MLFHISGTFCEIFDHIFFKWKYSCHMLLKIMRGFWLKQGKENLAGGRGTPLNIKSNLKYNSGLIRVFEIYRINYCFLLLSKTGIFFYSHDEHRMTRPHIAAFSNGKRQSGHTFERPTLVQISLSQLSRLNSHYLAQTRPISPLPSGRQF